MVKYGKLYRELQIKEFQGNYIDYKKLKQKIKKMGTVFPRTSQEIITKQRGSNAESIKMNLPPLSDGDYSRNSSTATTYWDKYGAEFKEFKELLDQEFQRCYKFFKKIRRQLHNKINKHLYTQTKYSSYNKEDIIKEIGNLRLTMYLAKCLNAFINDNIMAIKKILKKFDKKFYNYFGNMGPKYILDNLIMQNSDLEYLLQFKIIDETSCIIESNVKLLRDYYKEINHNDKNNRDEFYQKYNEILGYIKDIDELIYFKIQYKEWFYFRKKDKIISNKSNLYKNIMYNPILFSAYDKDDLMHKFLSRKQEIREVEEMQIPLSFKNKVNIILIYIQTFFYNTLISAIYPLIFLIIRQLDQKDINYTFLVIASTYFSIYFSILLYHCFGTKRIKCAYTVSYILFFIGSLLYIFSFQSDCKSDNGDKEKDKGKESDDNYVNEKSYTIGLLVISRVLIGLGANPTMGKNYILTYSPKYFLPRFSKFYVLFSILGHAFGPFIGFILYTNNDIYCSKLLPYFYYTNYNCIGWYGSIFSLFFMTIHLLLFSSPTSKGFRKLRAKNSAENKEINMKESTFLTDDFEDSQDKEFYKLQKEMKNNKVTIEINGEEEDTNSINSTKINSKILNKNKTKFANHEKSQSLIEKDIPLLKINTFDNLDNFDIDGNDPKYNINPVLIYNSENKPEEQLLENDEDNGNFVTVNMIPRTIDDLIRKEKTKFSYLNRNLLIILTILFFNNLLKENFIAYCTYYTSVKFKDTTTLFKKIFEPKYLCLLISGSYLLEIISMLFILPFYKINTRIRKLLVILMTSTIIFMVPLSFDISLFYFFIIISILNLLSSIIEVLSSCYLAYLTPPIWKFSQINAGALPLYIMTFGKICGCLINLTSFINKTVLNNRVVFVSTFIGYGISGFYMIKSKNFRIKAIARIMRKSELESNVY